jgi:hypothetical protein
MVQSGHKILGISDFKITIFKERKERGRGTGSENLSDTHYNVRILLSQNQVTSVAHGFRTGPSPEPSHTPFSCISEKIHFLFVP